MSGETSPGKEAVCTGAWGPQQPFGKFQGKHSSAACHGAGPALFPLQSAGNIFFQRPLQLNLENVTTMYSAAKWSFSKMGAGGAHSSYLLSLWASRTPVGRAKMREWFHQDSAAKSIISSLPKGHLLSQHLRWVRSYAWLSPDWNFPIGEKGIGLVHDEWPHNTVPGDKSLLICTGQVRDF